MALLHIPLDQIDEARLAALIDTGAAESRIIEYKRTTYGAGDADYREFLADTSSFANTSGGDLVLGMEAANGVPTAIRPLTIPLDADLADEDDRRVRSQRSGLANRQHPVSRLR
jgi:Putative DNA-binding domain